MRCDNILSLFDIICNTIKSARKEIINNMAEIIDVADINIPELEIYTHLTDARLRKVYEY